MNTPATKESEGPVSADEPPLLRGAQLRSAIQWVNMVDPPQERLNGHALEYYSLRAKDLINPAASGEYPHKLSTEEVHAAISEGRLRPALQLERPLKSGTDFTNRLPSFSHLHTVRAEVLTRILMVVDGVEQFAGPGKFYEAFGRDPELMCAWYEATLKQAAGIAKRLGAQYPNKTVHMAVNVGKDALDHPHFVPRTLGILQEADAKPGTVGLELLESIPARTVDNNIGKLIDINALVPTSNDDCPDQHSMETADVLHAHGLPIERVKISGGYVKDMANGAVTPSQYETHLAWAMSRKPKGIVLEGFPGVHTGVIRTLRKVVCQMKKLDSHTGGVFEFEGCAERENQA